MHQCSVNIGGMPGAVVARMTISIIAPHRLAGVVGGADPQPCTEAPPPSPSEPERCGKLEAFARAGRSIPGMGELWLARDARKEAAGMGCSWAQEKK